MPECRDCHKLQASAEVRKLPKGDYRCKDRWACEKRVNGSNPR